MGLKGQSGRDIVVRVNAITDIEILHAILL